MQGERERGDGGWKGGSEGGREREGECKRGKMRTHLQVTHGCMLPCVARVRRCGQQEWTVRSRDRGTACLIPDSLRLCVCVCMIVCVCVCVCIHAFVKDRV